MVVEELALERTSISTLRAEERARVRAVAAVELNWWEDRIDEERDLIEVSDSGDHYCLVGVLRKGHEPKYLHPAATILLELITEEWENKMKQIGAPADNVYLSISSLFRPSTLQRALIEAGNNAALVSSHQAGMAIDFDPQGYYVGPERKAMNNSKPDFDPRIAQALKSVLEQLDQDQSCHFVNEYGFKEQDGTVNRYESCYHVCVTPQFAQLASSRGMEETNG